MAGLLRFSFPRTPFLAHDGHLSSTQLHSQVGQLTTNFYCGFLVEVSNSGQTVVVWFVSLLLIFQATHPSIRERIEFANSYKTWERSAPLVYGNVCKSE